MIKPLITSEQVLVKAATYNTNMDVNYIHDEHIIAAQYGWLRPAVGEEMYEDMMSAAKSFQRWAVSGEYASGSYIVHRYTDDKDTLKAGLFYSASAVTATGGQPQDLTAVYATANYFEATSIYTTPYHEQGLERALALFAMAEALPMIYNKIGGHGIMIDTHEFSTPVEQLNETVQMLQAKGKLFLDMFTDYICENAGTYPLFSPRLSNSKATNGLITYPSDKQLYPRDIYSNPLWRYRDYLSDQNS